MKKLQLLFILISLTIAGLHAQTVESDFIDGVIYMKFVDDFPLDFIVNEDRSVDLAQFPFLEKVFDKYQVIGAAQTLYLFNDAKLLRTLKIGFEAKYQVNEFIKELSQIPEIEYAEKITIKRPFYTPNDPYYGSLSGVNLKWHLDKINASAAWDLQQGTPNIKVAIIDNAIWGGHADLQISGSNLCKVISSGYNPTYSSGQQTSANPPTSISQTTNCSNLNYCPAYDWSHGTHCAGLVGAKNNNNEGVASIGGGVTLMGVRISTDGDVMYYADEGVQWAANNGAKVISMSYGASQSASTEQNLMQTCYNHGIILVAAAGNEGDAGNYINYPAGYSTVISVASIDQNGKLSYFSQYGSGRANIAAPGGFSSQNLNILSTTYCTSQDLRMSGLTSLNGKYYDGMQGTSMACPIVAGLCGLLASAYPSITPSQALNCLQSTAFPLASGSAQIDGNGYINAAAAVQCAITLGGGTTPPDPIYNCDWYSNLLENEQAAALFAQDHQHEIYKYGEIFRNSTTARLDSVAVYTYKVSSTTPNSSSISVKVYSESGGMPATVLSSKTLTYNQLANNGWTDVALSSPITVTGNFFVIVELNSTPTTDTVQLVLSASDGRTIANATSYFYHQNEWKKITGNITIGDNPTYGSFFIYSYLCPETTTQPCNAPTNLTATPNHNTRKIYLSWNAVSGANSYMIYRNGTQIATSITTTNYTDATATVGINYSYTVKAVCASGTSAASNAASTQLINQNTGINELNSSFVSIYPNPFDNILTVSLSTVYIKDITIFDMTGRVVTQFTNIQRPKIEIPLADINSAVYFIRITATDGSFYYDKIIKQ